jgi:hypothetical protein
LLPVCEICCGGIADTMWAFSNEAIMNRNRFLRSVLLAVLSVLSLSRAADAAGVEAIFDLSSPDRGPFPSDRFTLRDRDQLTGRRISMPMPDCEAFPSDCAELSAVNMLDGFNPQPLIRVSFSGAIDPATVTSASMFLVLLSDFAEREDHERRAKPEVVGINQVVWDPQTNTLHAQSDALLRQHSRYLLVLTRDLRDSAGDPVEGGDFARFGRGKDSGGSHDRALKEYAEELFDALEKAGVRRRDVVAASVFTTRSVTSDVEKIREQIKAATPAPATFEIVIGSKDRAVFDFDEIIAGGFTFAAQTNANPAARLTPTTTAFEGARSFAPGPIASIAFGRFESPNYLGPGRFIPAVPTRTGIPQRFGSDKDVYFNLLLPAGPRPPNGWPVVIFGHGLGAHKEEGLFAIAGRMASHGIASIGINAFAHGFGSQGKLTVATRSRGSFTFLEGGRGIDQDGNGTIDASEGLAAASPLQLGINVADGFRQTVIDHMQLVRAIEVGIDVDGDGVPDLDSSRIFYVGQSMGGIAGTIFMAVEPQVSAANLNVAGGSALDVLRLGNLRTSLTAFLSRRTPNLFNAPNLAPLFGFNENIPLRNRPPVVNDVAGAMALQVALDRAGWLSMTGNPAAYAVHLRQRPLEGMPAKDVFFQFARGDRTVPNPTTTAILRAGSLADRATYYRYDLVFAELLATGDLTVPPLSAAELTRAKNPHSFLPNLTNPPPATAPRAGAIAFAERDRAQDEAAILFASGEAIDPDGGGTFFEVPIAGPLPEELNFIP